MSSESEPGQSRPPDDAEAGRKSAVGSQQSAVGSRQETVASEAPAAGASEGAGGGQPPAEAGQQSAVGSRQSADGGTEPAPAASSPTGEGEVREAGAGVAALAEPEKKEEAEAQAAAAEPGAPPSGGAVGSEGPPALPVYYDGLESGLAWFGELPFVPPVPTGYPGPPLVGAAAGPAAERVAVSRKAIRERFEAKRKEAEATRKWYQRVPLPIWVCMPAAVFTICWIIFVALRPVPGPGARHKLDPALLNASPVANQDEALQAKGVETAVPRSVWRLLDNDLLEMPGRADSGILTFPIPLGLKDFEVACEVAFLETADPYQAWLFVGERAGVGIVNDQRDPEKMRTYVAALKFTDRSATRKELYRVKPGYWYELRIRVRSGTASYTVNGRAVNATLPLRAPESKATLAVRNARAVVRNWTVHPLP